MSGSPKKNCRKQRGSSHLLEFAPVFLTAISLFLLVSANLVSIGCAYASVYLIARECCSRAAKAPSFNTALSAMSSNSLALATGPLGNLARLTPSGGYGGSGANLYITSTNIYSSKTSTYGPNKLLSTIDTSSNVYECTTQVKYRVAPVMNFSSLPFLGSVPGFGAPVYLTCTAHKAIERPTAFASETSAPSHTVVNAATNQTQLFGVNQLCGWSMWSTNNVLPPGVKVVQQASGVVYAANPKWVSIPDSNNAPIAIKSGQRFVLFLNSSDEWSYAQDLYSGALGTSAGGWVNGMPEASIEFKVGENGNAYRPTSTNQPMVLPQSGVLYFRCNDNSYYNNSLSQAVTVQILN